MEIGKAAQQRDTTIDVLKGAGIYLVVLGHIRAPEIITNFIYTFHMPLFMFLSGCTFWYSYERRVVKSGFTWRAWFTYIMVRFASLMIPYMAWFWIRLSFQGWNIEKSLARNFDALWYLPTLFGLVLLLSIAELSQRGGVTHQSWISEGIMILLQMLFVLWLWKVTGWKLLREILIYVMPFSFGFAFKRYAKCFAMATNKTVITLCIIGAAYLIPLYDIGDKNLSVLMARFCTGILLAGPIYRYTAGYVAADTKGQVQRLVERILCLFGRNSLEIYILHDFCRSLFLRNADAEVFQNIVQKGCAAMILCFGCCLISDFFKQSKPLKALLFGK